MAGDWRDDDRGNWRGQGRDRWPHERGWQRDWDVEGRSGNRDSRNWNRDYSREFGTGEPEYGNPNPGRFGSDQERNYNWSGEGYGGGYGSGYGERDRRRFGRDDNRGLYGAGWRNQQSSDYPGYGWSGAGETYGAGYGGYGGYGRDNEWGRGYGPRNQDRGFWDRASDEVSSWFGDEEAERRRQMDQNQGRHRGRGPKGYTRSDDRIREDVSDALSDDSHVDASEITVAVSNSEVTLTGMVDTRQEKRRAEDCAERVSGVKHVQNNLRVKETTTTSAFGSGVTSGTSTANASSPGAASTTRQRV